jgi:methionine-rich copper-binding protein CopC
MNRSDVSFRIRSLVGAAVIALVAIFSVTTGVSAANAHADEVSTSPVADTQVATPALISVTFTEELVLEYSSISLFDGAGNPVRQDPATLDASGMVLSSTIPETLAPGMYRVVWHNLSVDGHEGDGEFLFEVVDNLGGDGASTAEPTAEPSTALPVDPEAEALIAVSRAGALPEDSGVVTVQIIGWSALGAGVAAGVAGLVVVFVRRRRVG